MRGIALAVGAVVVLLGAALLLRDGQAMADPRPHRREGHPHARGELCARGPARAVREGGLTDGQLDIIRSAVASRDPYALHETGMVLAMPFADMNVRLGPAEAPVDQDAFRDAWTLAACAYGYPCGPRMRHIAHGCALLGRCGAADYREYLFVFQHPPHQSQLIDEYTTHVLRAVQGDWSRFTFHRGPSPWAAFALRPR